MNLIDANILLYAYDSSSEQHERARTWIEGVLSGAEPVGLAWVTILAFLRISTNLRVFDNPLSVDEAVSIVADWLRQPSMVIVNPGSGYWKILSRLLLESKVSGPLVMDAHLAALAIEQNAFLCTTDGDFERFSNLMVVNPLQATS